MVERSDVDLVVGTNSRLTAGDLPSHLVTRTTGRLAVDLRRLTFIDPAGLVSIAVLTERAVNRRHPVAITAPGDSNVANYIARMRLGQHFDRLGIAHSLPDVRENQLGPRLVELHRFEGQAGLERVVNALVQTFLTEHRDVQPLYAALQEIAENVIQHSGSQHGYAALQRFENSRKVEFAVADAGVGLRARLSESVPVSDARAAVMLAAQTHVTSTGQAGRGRGIGEVIAIAGRRRGDVVLVSGDAHGVFHRGSLSPRLTTLGAPHPGTLAHACLTL